MAKYKTNLIDKLESTSNLLKWIIIVSAAILALIILFWSTIFPSNNDVVEKKTNIFLEVKNIISPKVDTIRVEQKKVEKQIKEVKNPQKTEPKKAKTKVEKKAKISYKNSFNGYKIVGIVLSNGNTQSTVYLKKDDKSKRLNIDDKFVGYTLKEIHRTYILLANKNDKIHLNYIY